MNEYQPIETAPLSDPKTRDQGRILVFSPDRGSPGWVFGKVVEYSGERIVHGEGMSGDWTFTHWCPVPDTPK